MLDQICDKISQYTAKQLPINLPEAAVLIAITASFDNPEIIFTQRAIHLNTHSGEVAFPGGKKEMQDQSLEMTALRESSEEIDLCPNEAQIIGRMDQFISQFGIKVTPFIALVPKDAKLKANEQELDSIFKVPVRWFLQQFPVQIELLKNKFSGNYKAPSFFYEEYKIWGLTACMLALFLNIALDADIPASPGGNGVNHVKIEVLPSRNAAVYPIAGSGNSLLQYAK